MIDKITFFNDYGAGDIHYSREFVKDIMRKVPARLYEYEVRQDLRILKDINELFLKKASTDFRIRYIDELEINFLNKMEFKYFTIKIKDLNNNILFDSYSRVSYKYTTLIELPKEILNGVIVELYDDDDFLYHKEILKFDSIYNIETWVGYKEYFKMYNCTLYSNYVMFKTIYDKLDIPLERIDYYLPSIDFNNINIDNVDDFISNDDRTKVLISNGDVQSLQSNNFNFSDIIYELSNLFCDVLFLTTHKTNIVKSNVINISDITKTSNNINEISYLSTFCDIIIGRGSGPYCFTHIKNNFFNDKLTFIAFCDEFDDGIFYYGKEDYFEESKIGKDIKCKYVHSSDYGEDSVFNTIKNNILDKII